MVLPILNRLTLVVFLLFASTLIMAQKSKSKTHEIPTSDMKMKKIGSVSLRTVELNQLKKGVNTVKFSTNQTLEISFASGVAKKITVISGTGVRTPVSTTVAFQCSEGTCNCRGDADCNSMISSGVCKTNGVVVDGACVGSACICAMKAN